MNILQAMRDEQLFARWFRGQSWAAWRTFLKALFGLPVTDAELKDCNADEILKKLTG